MRKKLSTLLAFFALTLGLAAAAPLSVAAAALPASVTSLGAVCQDFLSFPSWCKGLESGGQIKHPCVVQSGQTPGPDCDIDMSAFIWTIAGNILEILLQLVGYVGVIMVIFGGFKYITAAGSASKIEEGTKTIANAMIGIIVGVLGSAIVRAVTDALGAVGDGTADNSAAAYSGILNRAATMLGIAAVIVILWGAFTIITASGNPTRISKGKYTVIFACVGLLVIVLAAVIANFALGSVSGTP
jgi:hypothetical protein